MHRPNSENVPTVFDVCLQDVSRDMDTRAVSVTKQLTDCHVAQTTNDASLKFPGFIGVMSQVRTAAVVYQTWYPPTIPKICYSGYVIGRSY